VGPAPRAQLSEDEYLARERASATKHEYIDGEVIDMSGALPRHNLVSGNIAGVLRDRLRDRPCFVLASDQRIHVAATRMYAYPDVTVVCGRPELAPGDRATIVNPVVIFEVLSDSTEAYDRGAKFAHYRHLASLREYLLVSIDARRVEHYRRLDGGQWLLTEVTGPGAAVALPVLDIEIPLAEVFAKLDLLDSETSPA
jgi:Uma2 family endonuclease